MKIYNDNYANQLLRGKDLSKRPWDIKSIVKKYSQPNMQLLDIGCGTASKTLPLANILNRVVGIDPSPDLINIARQNILDSEIKNFALIRSISQALPFCNKQFDIVTSLLSFPNFPEISRVLADHGIFICSCLGAEDKKNFTSYFGKDDCGWRGANLNVTTDELIQNIKLKYDPYFEIIDIINGTWETVYNEEGLWLLLNNTVSTVRNFDPVNDRASFDRAISDLAIDNKIILRQNRLLVVASNRPIQSK